jgi:hypothetical protein
MPTISQLPPATSISASDAVPVSQGGTARSVSVGSLLATTQPAIIVQTGSLLGRTSIGSGTPEPVSIGPGISLSNGTLAATGLDHAGFPALPSLVTNAELVICNQGTPMLMQASLLRGLFAAGQNVTITTDGTIASAATSTATNVDSAIGSLPVVNTLSSQDLVAVGHAGSNYAVTYANFLGGVTIDQAQAAGSVSDSDTIWVAQGSDVMASQNFGAISAWIAGKLPTYKTPVVEITTSTNLDGTVHNGRILLCSQPITLTPLTTNMGSGFHCIVINVSTGDVTLGSGFISSNGSLTIAPQQSASIYCATYSGGTIAFALMAGGTVAAAPGQVLGLTSSSVTSTTHALSGQAPTSGASPASETVQYRQDGTASWNAAASVTGTTTTLSGLLPATTYDIVVQAVNAAGAGLPSAVLIATTSAATQTTPPQVTGLAATPTSSSAVQLAWTTQTGTNAATSYTVQYRTTGSSTWTGSLAAITGASATVSGLQASTSYDFSVFGVNASGAGSASTVATAVTQAAAASVTAITWNMLPGGPYTHATGSIGVNAHVTPGTAPIRFGFSQSATVPPTSWTSAVLVNTDLWGTYVPTPATAGAWYAWAEGLDASSPTVSPSSFQVQ